MAVGSASRPASLGPVLTSQSPAEGVLACDFLTVETVLLQRLYVQGSPLFRPRTLAPGSRANRAAMWNDLVGAKARRFGAEELAWVSFTRIMVFVWRLFPVSFAWRGARIAPSGPAGCFQ